MPTYETFPALSSSASVNFRFAVYEWPNLKTEFENGWEEVRNRTPNGRYKNFSVVYRVNETDFNLIMDFLTARKLEVEPFTYVHPHFGTGIVRYASSELPVATLVDGNPVWFELELQLRGQF